MDRVILNLLVAAAFLGHATGNAQTGPGGVGSSSTMAFWLDANQLALSNGSAVETWDDESGNNNPFTQSTATRRPIFTSNAINGNPAVRFDGTDDYLISDAISELDNDNSISWFIVNKYNSLAGSSMDIFNSKYSDNTRRMGNYYVPSSPRNGVFLRDVSGTDGYITSTNTSTHIYSQIWDAALSSGSFLCFIDGASQLSAANQSTIGTHNFSTIGCRSNNFVAFLNGDIPEIFGYTIALNTAQRIIVENYLAAKYGLAISNDKYAFQAAYGFDVAGIGRESSTVNHTDSRGSGIVRINSADDLEDGEYMFWGHDNGSTSASNSEIPTTYPANGLRMIREWRADISGGDNSVGNVTVIFTLPANFGVDPANYDIITDPDGNFGDGDETVHAITPSVNGLTITFSNVPLADGDYFTIGNSNDIDQCASLTSASWPSVIWTCGTVPDSTTDVIISDGTSVTVSGTRSANNLEIETDGGAGGGNLTLSNNSTLIVKGDITINPGGFLTCGTGSTIIFRGINGTQTFANSSGSTLTVYNLTIANSDDVVTSGSAFALQNELSLNNGDLTANANLNFDSDATRTAHLGPILNGNKINGSGNHSATRFRSARDANWGDIATSGIRTDIEDLDGEIFISGIPGGDGYAAQEGGGSFVSFYYWDEVNDVYEPVSSTSDSLELGRGYEVYLASNLTSWNSGSWNLRGKIFTDPIDISINSDVGGNWNLLGNPYLGYLDWDNINNNYPTITNDEYWYWDANTNDYVAVSAGGGSFIVPGQGFWMRATSLSTISLDPSVDLLSGENTSNYFKRTAPSNEFKVHVDHESHDFGSSAYLRKDDNAYEGIDDRDITPLRHPDPRACHLFMMAGESEYMVNYVPTYSEKMTVPMKFTSGSIGDHTMTFDGLDQFEEYSCVVLRDETNGSEMYIDEESKYQFEITPEAKERNFTLILSKDGVENCEAPEAQLSNSDWSTWTDQQRIIVDFYLDRPANALIEVQNLLGETVHREVRTASYSREEIQLPNAASGVYMVSVSVNGLTTTDKIFIQ